MTVNIYGIEIKGFAVSYCFYVISRVQGMHVLDYAELLAKEGNTVNVHQIRDGKVVRTEVYLPE